MSSPDLQSPELESEVEDLLAWARVHLTVLRRCVAREEELSSSTPEERQALVLLQEAVQYQFMIENQIRHIEAFAKTGKASRPLEGEVRHLESTLRNVKDLEEHLDSLFDSLEL